MTPTNIYFSMINKLINISAKADEIVLKAEKFIIFSLLKAIC